MTDGEDLKPGQEIIDEPACLDESTERLLLQAKSETLADLEKFLDSHRQIPSRASFAIIYRNSGRVVVEWIEALNLTQAERIGQKRYGELFIKAAPAPGSKSGPQVV